MPERNKYILLTFLGLLGSFFVGVLIAAVASKEGLAKEWPTVSVLALFFCGFMFLLIWGGRKYFGFLIHAGPHPEFLHGRIKSRDVFETDGIKISSFIKPAEAVAGGFSYLFILMENAYDTPRIVTYSLELHRGIATNKERIKSLVRFNDAVKFELLGGMFRMFHIPLTILPDAPAGVYSIQTKIKVEGKNKGKRTRFKIGRSKDSLTLFQSLFIILFGWIAHLIFRISLAPECKAKFVIKPINTPGLPTIADIKNYEDSHLETFYFWNLWDVKRDPNRPGIIEQVWARVEEIANDVVNDKIKYRPIEEIKDELEQEMKKSKYV